MVCGSVGGDLRCKYVAGGGLVGVLWRNRGAVGGYLRVLRTLEQGRIDMLCVRPFSDISSASLLFVFNRCK